MPVTLTSVKKMTESQARELRTLCRKKGETVERRLTAEQAKCRIETLRLLHTLPNG